MTPAAPRRTAEEQARFEAALVALYEQRIAFNQVLGLEVLSARPGDVRGRIAMRADLVGHHDHGRLHGGVTASVLDAIGSLALMVALGERHPLDTAQQLLQRFVHMGTIDLRIDYLRPGLGAHFTATAEVTGLGARIGRTQMKLLDPDDRLLATGAAAYVLA